MNKLDDWPIKAYKNQPFLKAEEARIIRILCELIEPKERFAKNRIDKTIVLFGSARTIDPTIAKSNLKAINHKIDLLKYKNHKIDKKYISQRKEAEIEYKASKYYKYARDLSKKLTLWSMSLANEEAYTICSGGGPGIMEAANRGAKSAGGNSIGLGISLPFEQSLNKYIPKDLQFEFHYFFIRKYWFVLLAKALVAFPGGFGTLDELFETLTLLQTKKVNQKRAPIILFGKDFWNQLINFETLINWGMISKNDIKLIHITDSVEEAFDIITSKLKKN